MINIKTEIPRDISSYVKKRISKRIFLAVLTQAALAAIFYFLGDEIFGSFGRSNQIILYAVLLLAAPLAFGLPHKLIDRTWVGEVEKVEAVAETTWRGSKPSFEAMYTKVSVNLQVKLPSGKTVVRKVSVHDSRTNPNLEVYEAGDKVVHVYGTDYLQLISKNATEPRICVVCGTANPQNEKQCDSCGHTLKII